MLESYMYGERAYNHAILYIESKYSIPFFSQFFYDFRKLVGFGWAEYADQSQLFSQYMCFVDVGGLFSICTCSLPFMNLYYRQAWPSLQRQSFPYVEAKFFDFIVSLTVTVGLINRKYIWKTQIAIT